MIEKSRQGLGRAHEDLLKAVFKLQADGPVCTNGLAQALAVSPAAVTKSVRHLAGRNLLAYRRYRGVLLTDSGRQVALEVIRHHRLLELFLHDVLGYGWDEVDAEAERLEHHISELFEARIDRLLNYPRFDCHGDPIPTHDGQLVQRAERALAGCERAETLTVLRIGNQDPAVLQYLGRLGLQPGAMVEVLDKQPFEGPLTLRVNSKERALDRGLAGNVFVETRAGYGPARPGDIRMETD